MDTTQRDYWNENFRIMRFPEYDGFLDEYLPEIKAAGKVCDLGCGNGVDTAFLTANGIRPVSCDFSPTALDALKKRIPNADVRLFDMTEGLPFEDESFDVLIADLSLHYFPMETTRRIFGDIRRVLRAGGLFRLRVNAVEELPANGDFEEIEPDYYRVGGCTKRFFREETLADLLDGFEILKMEPSVTFKYGQRKEALACAARKAK